MKKDDHLEEIPVPEQTGFVLEDGKLVDRVAGKRPDASGILTLTPDEIRDGGGLPRAISRKAAATVRETFQGLNMYAFPPDVLERWEYILPHFRPHIDEYLSSLLLRACLPDEMHRLKFGETFLTSRDDDPDAKARWPYAAVLGIGSTVKGGAEPLLLFDEHEAYGEERENSSLVILMKRYLLGTQQLPYPFYQMLNEVNYIDIYGGGHLKNLATYVKYLNTLPANLFGGEEYAPTWKSAVVDACLTAFYQGLRDPSLNFRDKAKWEVPLKQSLADYRKRTPMRNEPDFQTTNQKITRHLTVNFPRALEKGDLKLTMTDQNGNHVVKGRDTGHEIDLNLLVPYLPYLTSRTWGGALSRLVMYFLWESRFYQEMLSSRTYETLCAAIPKGCGDADALETTAGQISIASCALKNKNDVTLKIYDLSSAGGLSPGPLNHYLRKHNEGFGVTIFRDVEIHSTVLTRGDAVDMGLWRQICDRLIEREGASDVENGTWHMTRNPKGGIANFLLNGNPTHRYVHPTSLTARSLARLVDECASAESV